MDTILDTHDIPKKNQDELNNVSRSMTNNDIEAVIKISQIKMPRCRWIYQKIQAEPQGVSSTTNSAQFFHEIKEEVRFSEVS